MANTKTVTIQRAGGTSSAPAEIIEGEQADQLIALAAPQLGLPPDGIYRLLGAAGKPITGDVYKEVKDGDTLTIAEQTTGGTAS